MGASVASAFGGTSFKMSTGHFLSVMPQWEKYQRDQGPRLEN